MARILRENGYTTGHFGKWHLGGQRDVDDAPPITAYGFDESLTNLEGMEPKLLPLTLNPDDTEPGRIWADAEGLGKPFTWMHRSLITTVFVDAAITLVARTARDGKPFYVNLWPYDVHSSFWPPVDKWAKTKRGNYLAVLLEMDRKLGKLFDHIRDTPAARQHARSGLFGQRSGVRCRKRQPVSRLENAALRRRHPLAPDCLEHGPNTG